MILLLKSTKYVVIRPLLSRLPEVRFCLSSGRYWKFFILKAEDDTLTYYESAVRCLDILGRDRSNAEDHIPLGELMVLLREWVSFSIGSLIFK